jgi:hypothetical protein
MNFPFLQFCYGTLGGHLCLALPHMTNEVASPLDNDDLLSEVLICLAPPPFSLPRVSLVCKRWRCLIADRAFLRGFRARHHCGAPLFGFFAEGLTDVDGQ